jgi:NitT/TauT family transport system substrate-binding protein
MGRLVRKRRGLAKKTSGVQFVAVPLAKRRCANMVQNRILAGRLAPFALIAAIVFTSIFATPGLAAQATRDLKEIKIAYPPSLSSAILMTAVKQKFFEREGFKTTLLIITSNLGLTSQTVGEIDYTLFGAASGILAAAQGLPIKIVHFGFKFADYTLVARPEFKNVGQLRGKKIAVSGFSGSIYSSTRAMLSGAGLDPDKDVTILQVGREDVRLQALFSGSIDATALPAPLQAVAEEKGFSLVADIEGKFEIPLSGLTVTDKKLRENPEEVKKVIKVLQDGSRFYLNRPAESVALYMDWLKLPKPIAERAYTRSLRFVSPDGMGKETAISNQLEIVRKATKRDVKQEDVIDFSLLKSLLTESR